MKRGDILTCSDGMQLEVISARDCSLTCCGQAVETLQPKTADAKNEKHVPVIEKIDGGYRVTVGTIPHPMEEKHWIEWIELRLGKKVYKEFLDPGQPPTATFLTAESGVPTAREHCNVHGLWQA